MQGIADSFCGRSLGRFYFLAAVVAAALLVTAIGIVVRLTVVAVRLLGGALMITAIVAAAIVASVAISALTVVVRMLAAVFCLFRCLRSRGRCLGIALRTMLRTIAAVVIFVMAIVAAVTVISAAFAVVATVVWPTLVVFLALALGGGGIEITGAHRNALSVAVFATLVTGGVLFVIFHGFSLCQKAILQLHQ